MPYLIDDKSWSITPYSTNYHLIAIEDSSKKFGLARFIDECAQVLYYHNPRRTPLRQSSWRIDRCRGIKDKLAKT